MNLNMNNKPHRRYNPLTGEYVVVSPQRLQRPWQGNQERRIVEKGFKYDDGCYLCPGNKRANGEYNPDYINTYVFDNDFPALLPDISMDQQYHKNLLISKSINGSCRVICFSPRHDLTMAEMSEKEIQNIINTWTNQYEELGGSYTWVQVFENKGASMGCSNPHPHGQIWASSFLPNELVKEDKNQKKYYDHEKRVMLIDYLELEMKLGERIVVENENWLAIVPFWAVWPFETILLPKRHIKYFQDLNMSERYDLSKILQKLLVRYDNIFEVSFPYTMGWHSAPFMLQDNDHWQLHAHFYPPLLRSSSIRKYLVGYEMLSESQRDITAEQAAEKLRNTSEIHYKLKQ